MQRNVLQVAVGVSNPDMIKVDYSSIYVLMYMEANMVKTEKDVSALFM